MRKPNRTLRAVVIVAAAAILVLFLANAGGMLILDAPNPSDVILVLAGETDRRPALALKLLERGYAHRIILDVPAEARIYGFAEVDLAKKYVQTSAHIVGLSTKDESRDAEQCLSRDGGIRVLIVTSDFHTRRSLSVFTHEVRGKMFSIAAARDDAQFGARWWRHRQWAKTCLQEWMRLLWWSAVDRWR
jgi:hypothetical protein